MDRKYWLYILFALLLLVVFRWDLLQYNGPLNVDEAQMVVQGRMFGEGYLPWLEVDTTTSGPLNSMLLTVLMKLGMNYDWLVCRVATIFCLWGAFALFIRAGLEVYKKETVYTAGIIPLSFIVFSRHPSFVCYATELLPVLLLSIGTLGLAKIYKKRQISGPELALYGFALCGIVFAKIQGAFIGLYIGVLSLILLWRNRNYKKIASMLSGVILMLALFGGVIALGNAWEDFWLSYILSSWYFESPWLVDYSIVIKQIFFGASQSVTWFTLIALCLLYSTFKTGFRLNNRAWIFLGAIALALHAILTSGFGFMHYLWFLVYPLSWLLAEFLSRLEGRLKELKIGSAAILLVMFSSWTFGTGSFKYKPEDMQTRPWVAPWLDDLAKYIEPGERVAIWGYSPKMWLHLDAIPGTRDVVADRYLYPHELRKYYLNRYFWDLMKIQPRSIINISAIPTPAGKSEHMMVPMEYFAPFEKLLDKYYEPTVRYQFTINTPKVEGFIIKLHQRKHGPQDFSQL